MISIKSENPNYLARVVKMPATRIHPNAERLLLATLQGQTIIVGKDTKEGELYILWQLESKVNPEFLAYTSNYSDPTLNRDNTKKSFFSKSGRVKACRLRGILSEGYLHPVSDFNEWLASIGVNYKITENDLNKDFDYVGEVLISEKYVSAAALRQQGQANKKGGKVKKESRLVDNQFRLSPDYKHLKREIHSLKPDDWIDCSAKFHGCNAVIARILTKRDLTWYEKLLKKIGIKIDDKKYDLVFSSRRCLKSEEFRDNATVDFYGENVWGTVAKKYCESLRDGISLIGEICGYTSTGAGIQSMGGKVFDYGCEVGKCDFFVFRITYTSTSGDVYEFSAQQVIDYCEKMGLKHVPFYYIGKAKDKYPELSLDDHWHQNFLEKMIAEYLEKDDIYCKNRGLPDEGIVMSKRVSGFEGLKLKSARFLEGETKELDKDTVNIEDVA